MSTARARRSGSAAGSSRPHLLASPHASFSRFPARRNRCCRPHGRLRQRQVAARCATPPAGHRSHDPAAQRGDQDRSAGPHGADRDRRGAPAGDGHRAVAHVQRGAEVKAGAALYKIDPATYRTAYESARAIGGEGRSGGADRAPQCRAQQGTGRDQVRQPAGLRRRRDDAAAERGRPRVRQGSGRSGAHQPGLHERRRAHLRTQSASPRSRPARLSPPISRHHSPRSSR